MTITVLQLTKQILSSMDSDDVASINDTAEAGQVATLINEVYEEILTDYDLQASKQLFSLTASGDINKPNIMTIPSGYHSIEWIRYNAKDLIPPNNYDNWVVVTYMPPSEFLEYLTSFKNINANPDYINVIIAGNTVVPIKNTEYPFYWTTFDDRTIIFDSYKSTTAPTLESIKTSCYGSTSSALTLTDAALIPLPYRFIPLLRNEVRARAFDLFKDGAPLKIEQATMRSRVRLQRQRYVNRESDAQQTSLPNYGKNSSYSGSTDSGVTGGSPKILPWYLK